MIDSTKFRTQTSWDDFTSSRPENFHPEIPINILFAENVSYVKSFSTQQNTNIRVIAENMLIFTKMSNGKHQVKKWELHYSVKTRKFHQWEATETCEVVGFSFHLRAPKI
ncbi:hypothetical protein V6Z11_A05G144200 [Gossypium hirsutum]